MTDITKDLTKHSGVDIAYSHQPAQTSQSIVSQAFIALSQTSTAGQGLERLRVTETWTLALAFATADSQTQ